MELIEAIRANDLPRVKQLIREKYDVNYVDESDNTPLIEAARLGYADIGLALILGGADYNYATLLSFPLMSAVINNRIDFVVLLLEQENLDIDNRLVLREGSQVTAVWTAAINGSSEILELLLGSGANPNIPVDEPALMAVSKLGVVDSVRILLNSPSTDKNQRDNLGQTALWHSVESDKPAITKLLLEGGCDPNIPNNIGVTPLIFSAFQRPKFVTVLLKYNADPNVRDNDGDTALMYSVDNVTSNLALLSSRKIDLDIRNNEGQTALMMAVVVHASIAVSRLIDRGADPFIRNNDGATALQLSTDAYISGLLAEDEARYRRNFSQAKTRLLDKFVAVGRLRSDFGQRYLPEHIVRQAEYDELCLALYSKPKPRIQALAASLNISLTNKNKLQLCTEISDRLRV